MSRGALDALLDELRQDHDALALDAAFDMGRIVGDKRDAAPHLQSTKISLALFSEAYRILTLVLFVF